MTRLTFYPLNNADTCLIELQNGKLVLVDYAHCKAGEDDSEPVIDLKTALTEKLVALGKSEIDVVLYTHADRDHIRAASEFFWFNHAAAYQSEERIKIKELWVPAALVLEENLTEDARVIRQEARHRLHQGTGIRVFSWPELLHGWMDQCGLSFESLRHLITDAGNIVPGFSLEADGVEFFAHSPFAHRDGDQLQSRNEGSVVLHATFEVLGQKTKVFLGADCEHPVLAEIVRITKAKGRDERLEWDVFKLPHHCSYGTLGPEKGVDITVPVPDVAELYEKGFLQCTIVSTSMAIPSEDTDLPPHRQAARYYENLVSRKRGQFIVTMEYPTVDSPKPLEIVIDHRGPKVDRKPVSTGAAVVSSVAPRAG